MLDLFHRATSLGEVFPVRTGLQTGDNETFVRLWHEVDQQKSSLKSVSATEAQSSQFKWFPLHAGGSYRRWYGNSEKLVDWLGGGVNIKQDKLDRLARGEILASNSKPKNEPFYFLPCVTWTRIKSKSFGVRICRAGSIFDMTGPSAFPDEENFLLLTGFLNSKIADLALGAINPTITTQPGDVSRFPWLAISNNAVAGTLKATAQEAVKVAATDWDNFETSWDFRDQPMLRPGLKGGTLEASWRNWEAQSTAAIRRMQELETENNRLFIAAYGLDGELEPAVPDAQITLARAEARRDMAAFLSYAVGCMMGRYCSDHPGLILANAGDSLPEFLEKVGKPLAELTYAPDEDGIIPVLDGEWFEDDIVARTRDFLRATFGEATLRENLRFIEDSLGKDLRKYFLNDFYRDHLQTYKKRPIYWLVQSPKKSFSALFYLHRYTRDTMNLVLNSYLRDYEVKLRNRLAHVSELQVIAATAKARTEARKETDKLTKILAECEEWERQVLLPLAQARIELDLDDGVKTNYLKLGEALATIPGLAAKEEE